MDDDSVGMDLGVVCCMEREESSFGGIEVVAGLSAVLFLQFSNMIIL